MTPTPDSGYRFKQGEDSLGGYGVEKTTPQRTDGRGLLEQHNRDSATLAAYAKEKNDLRETVRQNKARIEQLEKALRGVLPIFDNDGTSDFGKLKRVYADRVEAAEEALLLEGKGGK